MAQTRKQLNNKLTIATAQLATHEHNTRRTLNERVRSAEAVQRNLATMLKEADERTKKLVLELNNRIAELEAANARLADRCTELEIQINGDAE